MFSNNDTEIKNLKNLPNLQNVKNTVPKHDNGESTTKDETKKINWDTPTKENETEE
jgi:hypothetical protein